MKKRGAPIKPEDEKSEPHNLRWPRKLWARLVAVVPERKRARFIHQAVTKALDEHHANSDAGADP